MAHSENLRVTYHAQKVGGSGVGGITARRFPSRYGRREQREREVRRTDLHKIARIPSLTLGQDGGREGEADGGIAHQAVA